MATVKRDPWERVAAAVNARMTDLGMHQQVDLVERSGLSDATVRVFMTGVLRDGGPPGKASKSKLCDALGWSTDSIDRLLAGEEPVELVRPSVGVESRVELLERRVEGLIGALVEVAQLAGAVSVAVRLEAELLQGPPTSTTPVRRVGG